MNELLSQIDKALDAGFYYVGLVSALTVPDICGALEVPGGRSTGALYIAWFDRWIAPKYLVGTVGNQRQFLSGADCYQFRCKMLHQGTAVTPQAPGVTRFLFIEPGATRVVAHNNLLNGALMIDVGMFCRDVTTAARAWLQHIANDVNYQTNAATSVQRFPTGLHPYIAGVPVIG